jgi:hypothetical protein
MVQDITLTSSSGALITADDDIAASGLHRSSRKAYIINNKFGCFLKNDQSMAESRGIVTVGQIGRKPRFYFFRSESRNSRIHSPLRIQFLGSV